MKLLLTGATGFIGQNLVPALLFNNDIHLLLISRDLNKSKKMFPDGNITHATIKDETIIVNFDPDCVIHLAAKLSSKNDKQTIDQILEANIRFGVYLLDILKKCKNLKFFVNIGSFAEYRLGVQSERSSYFYSASKTAFRSFLDYYSDLCRFNYINLILYTVYGGKDSQKKIIDYIMESFDTKIPIKMSPGEQILDFIHIDDIVSFFIFMLSNIDVFLHVNRGEVLHLGTGRGTSIRQLVKILEKKYNRVSNIEWGALPYRDMDVMKAIAPIERLSQLGWMPRYFL